jgi:hypothetical protein
MGLCVPAQSCAPQEPLAGESGGARRGFARLFEQLDGQGFALPIVHIHANDYSPISNEGIPHTLEISFSANANISEIERKYPQGIDQPNNPEGQNIRLVFQD